MPKLVFSTFRPSSLLPKLVGAVSDLLVGQGHSALQWQASRSAPAVSWGRTCAGHTVWFGNVIRSCVEGSRATSPRTSTNGGPGSLAANLTPASLWSNFPLLGAPHLFDASKKRRACVMFCEGQVRAGPLWPPLLLRRPRRFASGRRINTGLGCGRRE